jgi:hypothetical protein
VVTAIGNGRTKPLESRYADVIRPASSVVAADDERSG